MIQCFVQHLEERIFSDDASIELVHVCKTQNNDNRVPRIMHKHDDMVEIVFISEGSGTYIINGKKYLAKKGDLLIYNKGILHEERSNPECASSTYVCGLKGLKMRGMDENVLIPTTKKPILDCGDQYPTLISLFELMYNEVSAQKSGSEEIARYLLLTLLRIIVRLLETDQEMNVKNEFELSERVKTHIDQHFMETVSIESISWSLGISQFYLIRAFKKRYGITPKQYLISRKIGEAQNLLINTDYSIIRIAEIVGYDNSNYFNLLFKKTVGMTPGKYRSHITTNS